MGTTRDSSDAASETASPTETQSGTDLARTGEIPVLVVGDFTLPSAAALDTSQAAEIQLPFAAVTAEALDRVGPKLVLSALVTAQFDCLDLAERLYAAGFRGRYRAVARSLPNPGLIRHEVAARCPGLDFDVLVLDAGADADPPQSQPRVPPPDA